jgi:hypothetical protein
VSAPLWEIQCGLISNKYVNQALNRKPLDSHGNSHALDKKVLLRHPVWQTNRVESGAGALCFIAGVVGDSKYTNVREKPSPMAYFSVQQLESIGAMHLELRTHGDPK